jgi:hypothetical protein
MVRRSLKPPPVQAKAQPSSTLNILLIVARPRTKQDVSYRTISRPLVEGLRTANLHTRVDIVRPGTYQALFDHLENIRTAHGPGYYHVIHFDVHGALLRHPELKQDVEENRLLYQARYGRHDIEPYEGQKAFLFLEGTRENQADPVEAS